MYPGRYPDYRFPTCNSGRRVGVWAWQRIYEGLRNFDSSPLSICLQANLTLGGAHDVIVHSKFENVIFLEMDFMHTNPENIKSWPLWKKWVWSLLSTLCFLFIPLYVKPLVAGHGNGTLCTIFSKHPRDVYSWNSDISRFHCLVMLATALGHTE